MILLNIKVLEWRRKYFNILSSSSSESFWRSWPSPDSWVKLSILSLPFLYFCCLALMRSILNNKIAAAMPRTHPQLPTHLCTQPKLWMEWQQLGLVDGCLLATSISLFLLFSQVLPSSLKEKCCLPHIVVKIKWKDV